MPPTPSSVFFDAARGLAVLRTPNSVYAVRIGADGSPRHLHWGNEIGTDALGELLVADSPAASSFESDPAPDELAPQSGARFGPAGLQVRFADGTRGAQWTFTGHTVRDGELRLQLADRRYPLAAELCYRVRPDSDVIERWTELTHTGADDSGPIAVDRLDSASWTLAGPARLPAQPPRGRLEQRVPAEP